MKRPRTDLLSAVPLGRHVLAYNMPSPIHEKYVFRISARNRLISFICMRLCTRVVVEFLPVLLSYLLLSRPPRSHRSSQISGISRSRRSHQRLVLFYASSAHGYMIHDMYTCMSCSFMSRQQQVPLPWRLSGLCGYSPAGPGRGVPTAGVVEEKTGHPLLLKGRRMAREERPRSPMAVP